MPRVDSTIGEWTSFTLNLTRNPTPASWKQLRLGLAWKQLLRAIGS